MTHRGAKVPVVGLAALAILVGSSAATAAHAGPSVERRSALEAEVLEGINALRAQDIVRPLVRSSGLGRAATLHSRVMLRDGFFDHEWPDGTGPLRRAMRFLPPSAGAKQWRIGETIQWRVGAPGAGTVIARWMTSALHRRILLSPSYREVGVAAVRADRAPGVFGGRTVTVIVVVLGSR